MKKVFFAACVLLANFACFGQYTFGLYAGGQYCSSHQKVLHHQSQSMIIVRHYLPDFGFAAGISLSRPLSRVFSISNQTGYSQKNLRHDNSNKDRFTMHFLTTEFTAHVRPFVSDQLFLGNISIFAGPGFNLTLKNDALSKSILNGNPLGPYLKTGFSVQLERLSISPFMEIPLASFHESRLGDIYHYDLYLRTYGLSVRYNIVFK